MNTKNNLTSLFAKWCNRSIGSTSGQTEQWPTSADQFQLFLNTVDGINSLFRCRWKKSKSLMISNFSQSEVSSAVFKQHGQGNRLAGKKGGLYIHWTKLRYRFREVHSQAEWGQRDEKKRPETENCWAIHKLSPKMSMELICYFLVAEKLKTSGSQTFVNWKCHQLYSNSESTENNWRKKYHCI